MPPPPPSPRRLFFRQPPFLTLSAVLKGEGKESAKRHKIGLRQRTKLLSIWIATQPLFQGLPSNRPLGERGRLDERGWIATLHRVFVRSEFNSHWKNKLSKNTFGISIGLGQCRNFMVCYSRFYIPMAFETHIVLPASDYKYYVE